MYKSKMKPGSFHYLGGGSSDEEYTVSKIEKEVQLCSGKTLKMSSSDTKESIALLIDHGANTVSFRDKERRGFI